MPAAPKDTITLYAIESDNIDSVCYRGSAPLSVLARLSQVDVFDQVTNPDGLQRDLSRKHAQEAYDYAARTRDPKHPRAFPEVVLNVRDKKVVTIKDANEKWGSSLPLQLIELEFDTDKIDKARGVKVSRVDGNHRLFFGNGDGKERGPLDTVVPFQLHVGLTRDQEGGLFLDINAEQKGLNTSHLHTLRSRLTTDDIELEHHRERVFARRLANDAGSPWRDLVFMGGSKKGAKQAGQDRPVSFVALESAIRRMLRAEYAATITDPDGQYGIIRNYWLAVRAVFPAGWDTPREYLMLKNVGLQALATLGTKIINRSIMVGQVDADDMAELVRPCIEALDWGKESPDLAGMSGNRAALLISGKMEKEMPAPPTAN